MFLLIPELYIPHSLKLLNCRNDCCNALLIGFQGNSEPTLGEFTFGFGLTVCVYVCVSVYVCLFCWII